MSLRCSLVALIASSLGAAQSQAAPPICDNPAAAPAEMIAWQPSHQSFAAAFDNDHLFLTEFNLVHR